MEFESLFTYGGITEDEVGLLSPEVATKLNIAFDNINHDAKILKEELAKLQKAQETSISQYSADQYELKSACEKLEVKLKDCNDALYTIQEKLHTANSEKEEFRTKLNDCLSVNNELSLAIHGLENEKEILTDQLKSKLGLIDSLTSEISELRSEAETVRKLKVEMMLKSEDIVGRESSIKSQEARWSDELSNLQRHNDWLEERLRQTTDQLLTTRRDSYQKSYSIEAELGLRNIELENSKQCVERLEENVQKLTQANEEYIVKLKLVTDEQIKMEQLYGNEIEAQKQLINLYKEQVKELEEKNEELSNALSSMQGLLKDAYENVTRLETENSSLKAQYNETNSKLQTTTENLALELEKSQHLLDKFRVDGLSEEELRQLNPSVAATLSALKRGHSLTQLYADYIQVVEDRDQLKLDKQRLTEYVEQMVDELKEKAPLLRNQQEDYQKLQTEFKDLTSCYQYTSKKLEEVQLQRRESERRAGFYHRETCRLKQTCSDLSKQVKSLLYEVEISRGTVIRTEEDFGVKSDTKGLNPSDHQPVPDSSMDISNVSSMLENLASSSAVIDDHLVTWRNLDELQSQNQRLLCVARDLATQLEKREQEDSNTTKRISELSARVDTLSGELNVVRLAAREARTEANIFSQQRDQYRALLRKYDIDISDKEVSSVQSQESISDDINPTSHSSVNNKTPIKGSSPSNGSSAVVERLERTLSSLQIEFARYREDKVASDNVYTTTVDNLRKECNEARLLNQKLSSQLDFTHEKLRASEANVAGYKQEITILREMNARYSTSAASSEAELSRLRDELAHTSDRLTTAEVDARYFSRQLEAVRANETRLKQEIDSLRRHDQIHSQLMLQLQSIQGNLEQRESMDRSSSERKIEQLEKQISAANSALVDTSKASQMAQQTLQHELALSRESVESSNREIHQLNIRIRDLEEKLATVQPSHGEVAETNVSESSPECSKKAQIHVRELEHEIEILKSSLDSSRQQSDRLKTLAEQAEERLNEIVEENKRLEEHFSRDMCETKQRCEFLEAQLDLERKERQNLVNENIRTTEEAHKLNADLRRELASIQNELESSRSRCESALQVEASAKDEIESHQQAAQEARDKYERELTLHAQDVELLTATRSQLDSIKMRSGELQQELNEAKSKSEAAVADLKSQSELWDSEKQELNRQLKQCQEEQNLLQDQLIQLTQQMVSLRKSLDKCDISTGDTESIDSDIKTSEELLQVIGYLRRQKNMASVAYEAASSEVSRLLLRVSSLESQKEKLQSQLDIERKATELAMETSHKHSEVMERVEQLNLVTESNRLLRHEREILRSKLSDAENQLAKLIDEIDPLKQSNSDLIAQKDILMSDKRSLEEERDRWKERCSRLVETAQRMDPEQYRLACNERDELQHRLNRAEEEVQINVSKLNDLRNESDSQIKKLNTLLESVRNSYQEAEQKIASFSVQENLLKEDLSAKETTIMKLREIGRKYRQETEVLRRKLNDSRSDEAQLQTTNEALTEVKADLVTLRSDYSSLRTEYDLLEASVTEAIQLLDEMKAKESVMTIMNSFVEGSDIEITPNLSNSQKMVNEFRRLLSGLCNEIDRLQQHSDSQKERLLRTQLIESQLTKSQKDCADLRARLNELQSISIHPQTVSVSLQTSGAPSPGPSTFQESELQDGSHTTHTFVPRALALGALPINPATANQLHFETPSLNITDSNTEATSSLVSQPVPAWVMRAGATVQPVHPTPAITPPNSLIGPKQTAEIRPITSNVAAVMPTLAPSSVPMMITSGQSENISSCGPSSIAICSSLSDTATSVSSSLFSPCDQTATSLLRSAFLRRGNMLNQPHSSILTQVSSHPTSSACSSSVPSSICRSATVSITGKRRFEESYSNNSNVDSTLHIIPPPDDSLVSTSDISKSNESLFLSTINANQFHPQLITPSSIPSESKRIRQAVVGGSSTSLPVTQASPSPIVLGRSPFGISIPAVTPLHATASRLVAGQQEPSGSTLGTLTVTTGVAGIITPGTFETSDSVDQLSTEAGVETEQSTASDIASREIAENESNESNTLMADYHTEDVEIVESEAHTSDQSLTSPTKPTSCAQEEVCESSDDEQECYSENDAFYDPDQRDTGSVDDEYAGSDSKNSSFDANNDNNVEFSSAPANSGPSNFSTEDSCKKTVDTIYNECCVQEGDAEVEQEYYMEGDFDEYEREDDANCDLYTEDEEEGEEEEVIELSSGSDDTQPHGPDGEERYSGQDNYCDEETDVHTAPTDTEVPESVDESNERMGDGDRQLHYETNSTNESNPTTQIPEKPVTSSNMEMEPISSSKSLFGESSVPGLFSNASLPKCSLSMLGSSGLFSGFKPSSLTVPYSVSTAESGLVSSSSCSGLFKSFLPVSTAPNSTTTTLLFKPSTFSTSVAVSKEPSITGDSGTVRPKIQPIVWDSFDPSTTQSSVSDSTCTIGPARRKKWCPVTSVPRTARRSSLPTSRGCAAGKPGSIRGGLPPRRG